MLCVHWVPIFLTSALCVLACGMLLFFLQHLCESCRTVTVSSGGTSADMPTSELMGVYKLAPGLQMRGRRVFRQGEFVLFSQAARRYVLGRLVGSSSRHSTASIQPLVKLEPAQGSRFVQQLPTAKQAVICCGTGKLFAGIVRLISTHGQ